MNFTETDYVLEPANVQTMQCVRSLNIANAPRQVVLPPEGVEDTETYGTYVPFVPGYMLVNARNLTGDIQLEAGWNCSLSRRGNTLRVGASQGAGDTSGQRAEVAVTPEELALENEGKYLSRGPLCRDLVASINGLYGTDIPLTVGDGILMTSSNGVITLTLTESAKSKACDMPSCEADSLSGY